MINSPFHIGKLKLPHRLIQGPLAGYSCAPFRTLFNLYTAPAYCVSEMISAQDLLHKHSPQSRYLYRDPAEQILAYQIAGKDKFLMADAALYLQDLGADLIDINCGCPKNKIRKKGAGSALLEEPDKLLGIVEQIKKQVQIPLSVKIRIQHNNKDIELAQQIEAAGADALIVHGRHWTEDYAIACDLEQIAHIKQALTIPIIANGDIKDATSLEQTITYTGCDAFMISRAGTGQPWLFQTLLDIGKPIIDEAKRIQLFITHLQGLATLESEIQALLQSKSLIKYYFKNLFNSNQLQEFYQLSSLNSINIWLQSSKK